MLPPRRPRLVSTDYETASNWIGVVEQPFGISRYLGRALDCRDYGAMVADFCLPNQLALESPDAQRSFRMYLLVQSHLTASFEHGHHHGCSGPARCWIQFDVAEHVDVAIETVGVIRLLPK